MAEAAGKEGEEVPFAAPVCPDCGGDGTEGSLFGLRGFGLFTKPCSTCSAGGNPADKVFVADDHRIPDSKDLMPSEEELKKAWRILEAGVWKCDRIWGWVCCKKT